MSDTDPNLTFLLTEFPLTQPLDLPAIYGTMPRTLEVDVGCGKGRFLVARAAAHPEVRFLGIDRSRARIHKLNKRLAREGIRNTRLILLEASYVIRYLLPPTSVSVFHFLFPDPWPKRRHHRRRLLTATLVDAVHAALKPEGQVNLCSDDTDYWERSARLFREHPGFREVEPFVPPEAERSNFEVLFLSKNIPIRRASFQKIPAASSPSPALSSTAPP